MFLMSPVFKDTHHCYELFITKNLQNQSNLTKFSERDPNTYSLEYKFVNTYNNPK